MGSKAKLAALPEPTADVEHLPGQRRSSPAQGDEARAERTGEGAKPRKAPKLLGTRHLIAVGLLVIALFFGFGVLWAGFAPLSSGAIAPGVVGVESSRKSVQHLEGGIVRQIHVREGDDVVAGQPLIQLDDIQARSLVLQLRSETDAALAQEARLQAELSGADTIDFPLELDPNDPATAQLIRSQEEIFASRRATLEGQLTVMQERIRQKEIDTEGIGRLIAASRRRLTLVQEEIARAESMVARGIGTRPQLFDLLHDEAELEERLVQMQTQIATATGAITQIRAEMAELRAMRHEQIAVEMRAVKDLLIEHRQRLPSAEDTLQRTVITAPLGGRIVDMQVHTIGGVISPGTKVLDIVPSGDQLVVEARLDPKDRDVVESGMPTEIRFTAFNQRSSMPVAGQVVWISADHLQDERSGVPYYKARIRLTEDPAAALNGGAIFPGMQATVMIVTGERTALSYLLRPLTRVLASSFRED